MYKRGRRTDSMFNIPEMIRNDQPAMRPIIKRPHSIPSFEMDRCPTTCFSHNDTPFPSHGAQRMSTTDQSARVPPSVLSPTSYMCIINTPRNTARSWTDRSRSKKIFKINENAVRLDDIEKWWYTENETVCLPNISYRKEYDDVDLNLFLIHRQAQEYNDYSDYQTKLDFFFLTSLLHQAVEYIKRFDLTESQKHYLQHLASQKENSSGDLFEHYVQFGYDCLIRPSGEEVLKKTVEHNAFFKNFVLSSGMKQNTNNLAVDFGMRFSLCNKLITTCNKHFEKSSRKRMDYTRQFYQSC